MHALHTFVMIFFSVPTDFCISDISLVLDLNPGEVKYHVSVRNSEYFVLSYSHSCRTPHLVDLLELFYSFRKPRSEEGGYCNV
jgi:hypothetical protein